MKFWAIAHFIANHQQQTRREVAQEIAFLVCNDDGEPKKKRNIGFYDSPRCLLGHLVARTELLRGLARAAGIELVFLAHLANNLDILTAGDKTDHGRGDFAGGHLRFNNISLPPTVRRVRALGIDHPAIIDLTLLRRRNRRPAILRRTWILDRKRDRIADDLLFRQRELTLALAARGWRTAQSKQAFRGRMRR